MAAAAVGWTLLVMVFQVIGLQESRQSAEDLALADCQSGLDRDLLYRRWAARHGGVYVPVTAETPPNPNLTGIVERDLTTPSGRRLTLVNPAYMTRQVYDLARLNEGFQGHITSLRPLREGNRPDAWETAALRRAEQSRGEVSGVVQVRGEPYLRLLRPLRTEDSCLKCHASQGYRLGDLRGGISVAVPLRSYALVMHRQFLASLRSHLLLWALGLVGLVVAGDCVRRGHAGREAAQRALAANEERFRLLYEQAPVAFQSLDADGRLVTVNDAWVELLGYPREEVMGASFGDYLDGSCRATLAECMRECLAAGRVSGRECQVRHRNGDLLTVMVDGRAGYDAAGTAVSIHCVLRDVTASRRAAAEVEASEQKYRALFHNDLVPVCLFDVGTLELLDANQAYAELYGYTIEQLTGGMLMTDLCADAVGTDAGQCGFPASPHTVPLCHHRRRDGTILDVMITGGSFMWQGRIVQAIVTTDITAQRAMEAERERLSTAIEQAAEVVMITDAEGLMQYVNPAFEQVTGYSREEALGQNPRLLKSDLQDEAFYAGLWRTLSAGETWCGQLVNRRKDGTLYRDESVISPVRDAAGRIVNYVAVKRDVTRETELAEQLRQAQKMEAVGQLAGGVAHDFNNLLQVINGYAELALDELPPDAPARQPVSEIAAAGERAAAVVSQLLAFSRRQVLQPTNLDLNDVVSGLLRMLGRLLGEHVSLRFAAGSRLDTVFADRGQVEQVLLNLCLNARDAMPAGGELSISTRNMTIDAAYCARHAWAAEGRWVQVIVNDTGCGMDAATLARIWEPFFTTKAVGQGTGLGLATVYGIVNQHGGLVSAASEVERGSTFSFFLPAVDRPVEQPVPPAAAKVAGGHETILVVEDEAMVLDLARRVLQRAGYRVLVAHDGREAVDLVRAGREAIDLALCDLVMPHLGGWEVAAALRDDYPELRFLFASGYHDAALRPGGAPAGAVLQKPFAPSDLLRQVRAALDRPAAAPPDQSTRTSNR